MSNPVVGFIAEYTPQYMTDGAVCFDIQSAEDKPHRKYCSYECVRRFMGYEDD